MSYFLRVKLLTLNFSAWIKIPVDVPKVETLISNLESIPKACVIALAFSIVDSLNLYKKKVQKRNFNKKIYSNATIT